MTRGNPALRRVRWRRITGLVRPGVTWPPGRDPDAQRHSGHSFWWQGAGRSSVQGGDLKWWFCDSGKGISPVEGAHLFDPFFCGRQAGRGLGLGLSRAGRIVAQAGGTLRGRRRTDREPSSRSNCRSQARRNQPLLAALARTILDQDGSLAQSSSNLRVCHHAVSQDVAIRAEEGHIERFVIIPMMPLQPPAPAAPDAPLGPVDQAQSLAQCRCITCGPRANASRTHIIK